MSDASKNITSLKSFESSFQILTGTSSTDSIAEGEAAQYGVTFSVPSGYTIIGIVGFRPSTISMLGVDGISFSSNKATVVLRNHGVRRDASVTVSVLVAKI